MAYIPDNPLFKKMKKPAMTDADISDHLPLLAKFSSGETFGTYNIEHFAVSDMKKTDQRIIVLDKTIDNFQMIAIQEIRTGKGKVAPATALQTLFPRFRWAVHGELACAFKKPAYGGVFIPLSTSTVPMASDGKGPHRPALLCKSTVTDNAGTTNICAFNVHILNKLTAKKHIAKAFESLHNFVTMDVFCSSGISLVMGDFNEELSPSTVYSTPWPGLTKLHCPHADVPSRTYTRIYSKLMIDHILLFDPHGKLSAAPGCDVLTKLAGQEFPKKLQDWLEISDHYPVFARFWKKRIETRSVKRKREMFDPEETFNPLVKKRKYLL